MSNEDHDQHGPPDFEIAGLRVWIFGREHEERENYWDGNWLRVMVQCAADGALVRASGAILHVPELASWLEQLREVYASLSGVAELDCIEPYLNAKIDLKDGRGSMVVEITPDHLRQQHRFDFEVDQSYLPALISSLERVRRKYPIRGA